MWGTIIPIVAAAIRLMVVSRGDAETLRSLVQNLNITALLLATVLPLGTTLLTVLGFMLVVTTYDSIKQRRTTRRPAVVWGTTIVLILTFLVIDVYAMPMYFVLINVCVVVVLILFTIGTRKSINATTGRWVEAAPYFQIGAVALAVALLVIPLVFWIALSGVWLPRERLLIGNKHTGAVYVLSTDDRWTRYMDGDHRVHIIATTDVKCRTLLGVSDSIWAKTSVTLFIERGDESLPAECPKRAPTPWWREDPGDGVLGRSVELDMKPS